MQNTNDSSSDSPAFSSRRQFLGGSALLGSAVVLSGLTSITPEAKAQEAGAPNELVLKLNDNPEIGKVGGWQIFDLGEESVIVANTEAGFVACSAKCTHKGCEVEYRPADKAFVCPCHGARFDTEGKVLKGPARLPLKQFDAQTSLIIANKKAAG